MATQKVLGMLEELITVDKAWRLNLTKLNELRHDRKLVTIEIAKLKKAVQEATNEFTKAEDIDVKIKIIEKQVTEQEQKTHDYLLRSTKLAG